MKKRLLFAVTALFTGCSFSYAQMTISKTNALFAPMFKMINTTQEVKLGKRLTTSTTVRTRPASNLNFFGLGTINVEGQNYTPFGRSKLSAIGNITELRIYGAKKGAFHGFYFGPYFTYTHYKLTSASIREAFHDANGVEYDGDIQQVIKLNIAGGGIECGTQGVYAKGHFCVDWTILGMGFGTLGFQGGIEASNTSENFDLRNYPDDVANTKMGIEKYFTFKRTIDATSVTIGAKIPFIVFRTGLSFGFGYGANWHIGHKKDKNAIDGSTTQPTAPTGQWR
ncbi:MAG TPA: hypothetical protein VL651_08915 [Bacteroidia bacterium]|jgi:hypothetical protein|nr:hypothetical protein [Bacteroidia bacterium]